MAFIINPYLFGGFTPPAAVRWRVRPFASQDAYLELAEIELRATIGGTNLATGGAALHHGWANQGNAFDGNTSTFANRNTDVGNDDPGFWIGYQLSTSSTVREVILRASTTPDRAILCGWLDSSPDGVTWTPRTHLFSTGNYTSGEARAFTVRPLATARASAYVWGIEVTANNGGLNTKIGDLQFRSVTGGPNLCTGGSGGASRGNLTGPTQYAGAAFDGSATTSYLPGGLPARLHYNFAAAPNPSHVAVQAPSTFASTDAPRDFTVFFTLDGITRTTVATITGATGWANSEIREYAL